MSKEVLKQMKIKIIMKKLFRNFLMMAGVGAVAVLSSCDETTEGPVTAGPSVTIQVETPKDTYAVGESVDFDIDFTAASGLAGATLTDGVIESVIDLNAVGIASDTSGSFTLTGYVVSEGTANTTLTVEFEIEDLDGRVALATVDLEIVDAINSFTTVLIGGFNNLTLGSHYDALADSVYSTSNIRNNAANQAKIDFVYYFSDASQRTIAAPDNSDAQTTWAAQNTSNPAWPFETTQNSTKFKQAAQGTNFEFINSNDALESAFGEVGTSESRITDLTAGATVAFQIATARGSRYGVFEVQEVVGNSSGSITLDVKIQSIDN